MSKKASICLFDSKCIYISLILLSAVAFSQQYSLKVLDDINDAAFYKAVHGYLLVKHPDEPRLARCMVDDFRGSKVAEKVFSVELLTDTEKLKNSIASYENYAEVKCKIAIFVQSPLGVCVLIAVLLLIILLACCLIKCICC